MNHLLSILLTAILCATASAQSIRTLGYNTTNGQVVAATNVTWTNSFGFSTNSVAAQVRTNLSLGWSALTNTNAATSLLGFASNGQVVANTGTNVLTFTNAIAINGTAQINVIEPYGGGSGISILDNIIFDTNGVGGEAFSWGSGVLAMGVPISFSTTNIAATTRANLGFSTNLNTLWTATNAINARSAVSLGATWLTNTNVTNFRTAIGLGASDDVAFDDTTVFSLTVQDVTPINIAGDGIAFNDTNSTNIASGKAGWRDSLGLPLAALTNTSNVTMMRALSGSTNTNHPYSGSISVTGTNNTNTLVFSNGILQSVQ